MLKKCVVLTGGLEVSFSICYFDKFDRTLMYSTTSKNCLFLCLCVLESITLDKSK